MSAIGSQITGISTVSSIICSGRDQRKHHSSASLAFVVAGEFPAQRASNAENVSIWLRRNELVMNFNANFRLSPDIEKESQAAMIYQPEEMGQFQLVKHDSIITPPNVIAQNIRNQSKWQKFK